MSRLLQCTVKTAVKALSPIALAILLSLAVAREVTAATFETLHQFISIAGRPVSPLLPAADGKLYGTLADEGGSGAVFLLVPDFDDPANSAVTILHRFNGADGSRPQGPLVEKDGWFYGAAWMGGDHGGGTLFRFDAGGKLETIYSFDPYVDGRAPRGLTLIGGAVYGATYQGGAGDRGTIFKFTPGGPTVAIEILHTFAEEEGASPNGELADGGDGYLYGLTYEGPGIDLEDLGTVFKIKPDGSGFATIHQFEDGSGAWPYGGLVKRGDFFYGTTACATWDCWPDNGTVFKIDTAGSLTKVYQFDTVDPEGEAWCPNGAYPYGTLLASGGALWGTTQQGGINDRGVVFRIEADDSFTHILDVDSSVGISPEVALAESGGLIWGTLPSGTSSLGAGSVFAFAPDPLPDALTLVHAFPLSTDGWYPDQGQLVERGGYLYGVTRSGGANGSGTIFKMPPGGPATVIYSFPTGSNVTGWLTKREPFDGWFYGTIILGKEHGGMIYRVNESGAFEELVEFPKSPESIGNLSGNFVEYGGYLYGTAYKPAPYGSLYRVGIGDWTPTIVHTFTGTDGEAPFGKLILSGGYLLGTTESGGSDGCGTVYRFALPDGPLETIHTFDGEDGSSPVAGLVEFGDFYFGTTVHGGSGGSGTIFRIDKSAAPVLTTLHAFGFDAGGAYPWAELTVSGCKLYGTASEAGANWEGVLFRINPTTGEFLKLHDFNQFAGEFPRGQLLEYAGALYGTTFQGGVGNGGTVFRFTDDPPEFSDDDCDGIANEVDLLPNDPSTGFSDSTTTGTLVSVPAAAAVEVVDDPAGVKVTVTGSAGADEMVEIQLEGKSAQIRLAAPGVYVVTDPPPGSTVAVESGGPAMMIVRIGSATMVVSITAGSGATLSEVKDDLGSLVDAFVGGVSGSGSVSVNLIAVGAGETMSLLQGKLTINRGKFTIVGSFVPRMGNGLNPASEGAVLRIGRYTLSIPAGDFTAANNGSYSARGTYGGIRLSIQIKPTAAGPCAIKATGNTVSGTGNPEIIGIKVGDDQASAMLGLRR